MDQLLTSVVVSGNPEAVAVIVDKCLSSRREGLGRQREIPSAVAVKQLQASVS